MSKRIKSAVNHKDMTKFAFWVTVIAFFVMVTLVAMTSIMIIYALDDVQSNVERVIKNSATNPSTVVQ